MIKINKSDIRNVRGVINMEKPCLEYTASYIHIWRSNYSVSSIIFNQTSNESENQVWRQVSVQVWDQVKGPNL